MDIRSRVSLFIHVPAQGLYGFLDIQVCWSTIKRQHLELLHQIHTKEQVSPNNYSQYSTSEQNTYIGIYNYVPAATPMYHFHLGPLLCHVYIAKKQSISCEHDLEKDIQLVYMYVIQPSLPNQTRVFTLAVRSVPRHCELLS